MDKWIEGCKEGRQGGKKEERKRMIKCGKTLNISESG